MNTKYYTESMMDKQNENNKAEFAVGRKETIPHAKEEIEK